MHNTWLWVPVLPVLGKLRQKDPQCSLASQSRLSDNSMSMRDLVSKEVDLWPPSCTCTHVYLYLYTQTHTYLNRQTPREDPQQLLQHSSCCYGCFSFCFSSVPVDKFKTSKDTFYPWLSSFLRKVLFLQRNILLVCLLLDLKLSFKKRLQVPSLSHRLS